MTPRPRIDVTFDVRSDAGGRDPDAYSETLRRYHRILWSKALPDGTVFELDEKLHHVSDRGEFWLSSDAITTSYRGWTRPASIVKVVAETPPDKVGAFFDLGCTVGAYIVFPFGAGVDGKVQRSINQVRGTSAPVRDRFDLTLECIRRHYDGGISPLGEVLQRHTDFFSLFESFDGYVEHFLLQDLVDPTTGRIRFFKPFDDFGGGEALPSGSLEEYRTYMERSMDFIRARNARIDAWAG